MLVHQSKARFRCLVCGRRWGKDRCCTNEALSIIDRLVHSERPRHLVPKVVAWFVYPTFTLADELWVELKRSISADKLAKPPNESKRVIELKGDARIRVRSAENPETLVAAGIDIAVIGEASRMSVEAWKNLRPALDSPGRLGQALLNTTPKGRDWVWEMWKRGTKGHPSYDPEFESFNFPQSFVLGPDGKPARHPHGNPYITLESWVQARKEALEQVGTRWFSQEIQAEFLSGEGALFKYIRERILPAPENPTFPLSAGLDVGRSPDFTVISVMDSTGRQVYVERMGTIGYDAQRLKIVSLCKSLPIHKLLIETNGPGQPFMEMIQRDLMTASPPINTTVEGFYTTGPSKTGLIEGLAVAFEQDPQEIAILGDPIQINELEAYETTPLSSGRVRYHHPEGGHDDYVMALALAWLCVMSGRATPVGTMPSMGDIDEMVQVNPWKMR